MPVKIGRLTTPPPPAPPAPLGRVTRPRATWTLIALNVLVYALEAHWGGSESGPTLYRMGALTGRSGVLEEPWRILSAAFLHIGTLHLLLNMWALLVFGSSLEVVLGWRRFVTLYGLSAVGGGIASAAAHRETLAAGASGAVWGLMVAELVLLLRLRGRRTEAGPSLVTIVQPLAINLLYSFRPGIDLAAHLGGGIAGGALVGSGLLLLRATRARERAFGMAAGACALAMAGSLVRVGLEWRPWELPGAPSLARAAVPGTPVTLDLPRLSSYARSRDVHVWGMLRRDPLAAEVRVRRSRGSPPPEVLGEYARLLAAEPLEPGSRRVAGPERVRLPQAPAVYQRVEIPRGVRIETWLFFLGPTYVRIDVFVRSDASAGWQALPARIAESVRAGP